MANVLAVSASVLACILMLASTWIWIALMLPKAVARAQDELKTPPTRLFIAGLTSAGATALVFLTFASQRRGAIGLVHDGLQNGTQFLGIGDKTAWAPTIVQVAGWWLLAPAVAALLIGSAAVVRSLQDRLESGVRPPSSFMALSSASVITSLAISLPIIGWLFLLPVFAIASLGAGVLSLVGRRSKGQGASHREAINDDAGLRAPS